VLSAPLGYLEEILADRDNHHAFVVQRNGNTIGLAELHLEENLSGALAFVIEDPYQRKGVGTAALQFLICYARELGLRTVTADVQIENSRALNGLRRMGPLSVGRTDDILHVELDLERAENRAVAS
jgi:RimJ/RimL family protein N-acetyltransferase